MDELKKQFPDQLWIGELDLSDLANIANMFRAAVQHFGRVHAVASNAGYSLLGAAEELQLDAIRHIVDTQSHRVNRTGVGNCGADALGGGRLVQVSSGAGQAAFPGLSLYCATKWGIEGFFDSLYSAGGRRLRNPDDTRRTGYYRTDFGTSGVLSPELDAYREGPVGMPCKIATGGYPAPGDPAKMAKAIVETFEAEVAPLRVALGQDVFGYIKAALTGRLDQIEAYKNLTTVSILPICTMYRHTCSANFSSAILTQRN